nr:MAG TPA: hypothetical protein [Caudoviricetes sp.]
MTKRYISGHLPYISLLIRPFLARVIVFNESYLRDEPSYRKKLKTHRQM